MTALAEAFKAAGVEPADQRLQKIVVQAFVDSRNNWDGAQDRIFNAVRNDAGLLWAMFEPYRVIAIRKLMSEVQDKMHAAAKLGVVGGRYSRQDSVAPSGSGRPDTDSHGDHARPASKSDAAKAAGGGQQQRACPGGGAPTPPSRTGQDAVAAVARLSMLDTFKANGQSIGDMTAAEATAWAGSQARNVRFVRMLTANLPANVPIRKFRTAEEADAMYVQATEMSDAE